jgi:hypothetical protein
MANDHKFENLGKNLSPSRHKRRFILSRCNSSSREGFEGALRDFGDSFGVMPKAVMSCQAKK